MARDNQICYGEELNLPRTPCTLPMNVIVADLPEVLIIEPKLFGDQRGFHLETFQVARYTDCGVCRPFVQDNLSRSTLGVLRGLHLQNPGTQGKLVSAMRGHVLDVAVDVRVGSPNFGRHVAVELNDENRRQLWVPRGFAHGFLTLSETADVFYKCDDLYSPKDEITVRWDDPAFEIAWGMENPTLSTRDAAAPLLSQVTNLPVYGQV
jgi:dTDP-4-dehydrorhamnose 3,5-epimerase